MVSLGLWFVRLLRRDSEYSTPDPNLRDISPNGVEYNKMKEGTKREMYDIQNELIKRFEGIFGRKPAQNINGR